jgi:hypothetical protein
MDTSCHILSTQSVLVQGLAELNAITVEVGTVITERVVEDDVTCLLRSARVTLVKVSNASFPSFV